MTDDRPYVEKTGGSYVRDKSGKERRVAGTVERDGPQMPIVLASTETRPADPVTETSKKVK